MQAMGQPRFAASETNKRCEYLCEVPAYRMSSALSRSLKPLMVSLARIILRVVPSGSSSCFHFITHLQSTMLRASERLRRVKQPYFNHVWSSFTMAAMTSLSNLILSSLVRRSVSRSITAFFVHHEKFLDKGSKITEPLIIWQRSTCRNFRTHVFCLTIR